MADIKEDIKVWLQDLNNRLKTNVTASVINTLPYYEKKYTLKDIYTAFGSFDNAIIASGLRTTGYGPMQLPSADILLEWILEISKDYNITITNLSKLPPNKKKYNISHIIGVFGCLSAALEDANLPVYNPRVKPKTLVDNNTTDIYTTIYPSTPINDKKRSKICTHLRRRYNTSKLVSHHISNTPLKNYTSKYISPKYIYKYFDTLIDAYEQAGINPDKYNLIDHLHTLYKSTGTPVTLDTPGLNIIQINTTFTNLPNALTEAKLTDMSYTCICYVCKKEFKHKTELLTLCNGCQSIHTHSKLVNENHENSIKYRSPKQIKFVKTYTRHNPDALKWERYFDYNGAKWDCTIILPSQKTAIYWFLKQSKHNPSHRFRKWLISQQYKYKLILIEEDPSSPYTSTLIRNGITINSKVQISEIINYINKVVPVEHV